jgi:DNA-binding FadR family transcriptional regulator
MNQPNMLVYETIVNAIKARISNNEWVVGEKLPSIPRLAAEFGVGVGSIREAARVLAAEGLIQIEHGRGMFVRRKVVPHADPFRHIGDKGEDSILALFEARRILEPELAAFAAERAREHDIKRIVESAAAMERLVATSRDFFEPDLEFHRQIAAAAQNPVLAKMMDGVNDLLLEGRKLTSRRRDTVVRAVQYHLLIADAIRTRNPIQARLLMLSHVNDAIDTLIMLQKIDVPWERRASAAPAVTALLLTQRALIPALSSAGVEGS